MLDSFSKWGFEMELLVTACERFHDPWDIFRKACAHVDAVTPTGDLGFARFFVFREKAGSGAAASRDGRPALRPAVIPQRPPGVGDRSAGAGPAILLGCSQSVGTKGPLNCVCWVLGAGAVLLHPRTGSILTSSSSTLCLSTVNTKRSFIEGDSVPTVPGSGFGSYYPLLAPFYRGGH